MTIQTTPIPFCPHCEDLEIETPMVLRQPKPGQKWPAFWGCSLYPQCRGTRNIKPDGTPETDEEKEDRLLDQQMDADDYPWGYGIDGWGDY